MTERYRPERQLDPSTLERLLTLEAEELSGYLRPVMNDAFYGHSNPRKLPHGYYESLLVSAINRPSLEGDNVSTPLVTTLTNRGIRVRSAKLPYNHLGAYDGRAIDYREELAGILRAIVIAHESAHHFEKHVPHRRPDPGQEAIAETAAMLALRVLGLDTSEVSIPSIASDIAQTAETNGFQLWNPQSRLPLGMRQAQVAARQIVGAVERGRLAQRQ